MAVTKVEAVQITCDAPDCGTAALAKVDDSGEVTLPVNWVRGTLESTGWGGPQKGEFVACGTAHIRKASVQSLRAV